MVMAGMREAFDKKAQPKVPKDKGRPKRKVKVTFNSPKTTKVTYG